MAVNNSEVAGAWPLQVPLHGKSPCRYSEGVEEMAMAWH
jgi:hypothetical protein